jgi:hypothetical protein
MHATASTKITNSKHHVQHTHPTQVDRRDGLRTGVIHLLRIPSRRTRVEEVGGTRAELHLW